MLAEIWSLRKPKEHKKAKSEPLQMSSVRKRHAASVSTYQVHSASVSVSIEQTEAIERRETAAKKIMEIQNMFGDKRIEDQNEYILHAKKILGQ